MDKKIRLEIMSPSGKVFAGEVDAVFLPGTKGAFEVLPGHDAIISSLECGLIRYRQGGGEVSISIASGFMINKADHLKVCIEK